MTPVQLMLLRSVWLFNNPSNALPATATAAATANCTKITSAVAADNGTINRRAYQSQMDFVKSSAATTAFWLNCQLNLGKIPFSFF